MGGSAVRGTHRSERARSRPLIARSPLLYLSRRLTDRDRNLLEDLFEHRVLTTHQIEELYFTSGPVTRRRLVELYRLGLIDRFQPPALGSAPYHYVLDDLGARVVAAQRGLEFRDLGFRKEKVAELPHRRETRHLVEANGFFTRVAWACRNDRTHSLTEWWGELRCRRRWGEMVLPDGYGRLDGPGEPTSFFLEYDRGTESPGRLAAKLHGYERVALLQDRPDALLFCFPDPDREASARKRLHGLNGIAVATASWDRVSVAPLGSVWLPLGSERRVPLAAFPIASRTGGSRRRGGGR